MSAQIQIERALVERMVHMDGYAVHILAERTPKHVAIMLPLPPVTLSISASGAPLPAREAAFTLTHGSAQALLDGLWAAGLRPSSGQGAADVEVVRVMREHINDLRIVAGIVKAKDKPTTTFEGSFE